MLIIKFPANSDEELTAALGKYLPAIILKLSSTKAEVRKKILEMLVHVNKRVKGNDAIFLPLDALLVQYQVGFLLRSLYLDVSATVLEVPFVTCRVSFQPIHVLGRATGAHFSVWNYFNMYPVNLTLHTQISRGKIH